MYENIYWFNRQKGWIIETDPYSGGAIIYQIYLHEYRGDTYLSRGYFSKTGKWLGYFRVIPKNSTIEYATAQWIPLTRAEEIILKKPFAVVDDAERLFSTKEFERY